MLAGRVAKSSAHYLVLMALQRGARGTTVGALSAGNADIGHASGAVRGADTAANIMEIIVTLGVPKGAPLLAAFALMHLSSASTIGIGLVAVSTIVTEFTVFGAVLPADGADSLEASLAVVEAKGAILLLIIGAGRERLSSCATISFLPARVRHVGVVVVMMEVVDGSTVVVLLSVSQGLLGMVGEVRHVLLILVVRVVAFLGHGIVVLAVEAAVVVRAIVEVLGVVVGVVVTVLHLVVSVVVVGVVMRFEVLWGVVMVVTG